MVTDGLTPDCRVLYLGGRRPKWRILFAVSYEEEATWRQRLATEMEGVCREMLQQGLHLTHIVPVKSSKDFAGGWTEGVWLFFTTN